jgi:hypothetical protein
MDTVQNCPQAKKVVKWSPCSPYCTDYKGVIAEREGFEQPIRTDNRQLTDFYARPKMRKRPIRGSEVRHEYLKLVNKYLVMIAISSNPICRGVCHLPPLQSGQLKLQKPAL